MRYPYVGVTMVELSQGALHYVQAELPQMLGGAPTAVMVQVRAQLCGVCVCLCVCVHVRVM